MSTLTIASLWANLVGGGRADFLVLPGGTVSYAQMATLVRRWLAQFDALGLAAGDRIIIRTANETAAVSCWLAALFDGVVPVMQSPDSPDSRIQAVAMSAGAGALVSDGEAGAAQPAAWQQVTIHAAAAAPGWRGHGRKTDLVPGLTDAAATRPPRLPADPDGLAYLLFTSGTTSSPSGVMITRANLCANLATLSRVYGFDAGSRIFNDLTMAHTDGLTQGPVLALANGAAVIRSGGFTLAGLEDWLNRVRRERATHLLTVPTVWSMIDAYAAHDDYFDAPEFRLLCSTAAKLPEPLWQRLEKRFGQPLFNQYGMTEVVAGALYAGPHPEMGAFGTVGKPIDCEARIAGGGAEGELELRGSNVFAGYWQNPDRTAASFTTDGWLKTGDLARRLDDGSYEILGRLKTVIMVGGFLIRPDEIDEAMLRHPVVRESATVAIDDALFGDVPMTAVVCDGAADERGLVAHARTHLENRKVPKRIVMVQHIPRGGAGKMQVEAVRAMILAAVSGAAATVPAARGIEQQVLAVAADVFRVSTDQLTLRTRQGDVPGWDSFSQINLIMAIEQAFGIAMPTARMAAIRTLGDVVRTIEDVRV